MKAQNQFFTLLPLLLLLASWSGTSTARAAMAGSAVSWGRDPYNSGYNIVPAAAQSGVIAIAAGSEHVVALTTNGSVVAWGTTTPANFIRDDSRLPRELPMAQRWSEHLWGDGCLL